MSTNFIDLNEYNYELPDNRIARYPMAVRDQSKLLHYRAGTIEDHQFTDISGLLPANAHLVFNNTKVIAARLLFKAQDGFDVEVFLLEPIAAHGAMEQAMMQRGKATWYCMVGNLKKWRKKGYPIELVFEHAGKQARLTATLASTQALAVDLSWEPSELTFADLLHVVGQIPLPPYLKRDPEAQDQVTYQTVYAKQEGAVAAPTAGLHFTDRVFSALDERDIKRTEVTLHVSAGTFAPVKAANALDHQMHREMVVVSRAAISELVVQADFIVPVGTTSMRTLESLYWYGVKVMKNLLVQDELWHQDQLFFVDQHFAYQFAESDLPTMQEAYGALANFLDHHKLDDLVGYTEIYIYPGYTMRVCKGIVTNFHQPCSTLMLLIASLIGDQWKRVYQHALDKDYRFLSYGDSSLLIP